MAAVTQPRASGIPQPRPSGIPQPKARGTSRLAGMQSQFQQREAAERQKRLAELAPVRAAPVREVPVEVARPAAATERTTAEPVSRAAAPPRQPAAARGRVTNGSGAATVSAGGRAPATGSPGSSTAGSGGKVRAMFQTRRVGTAASSGTAPQTSPIGWDKSYPLDPIKKSAPARASAPPPAAVSELVDKGNAMLHRTLSDDDLRADEFNLRGGSVRSSVTMPELTMPAIHVEREKPTAQQREAERQRINAELRRRDHELLASIRDRSQQQCGPLVRRPMRTKPAAAPAPARARRPEPAEPRKPAARAAPAPARPPSTAAKENRPPAPRPPPTDPNMAQCPVCQRQFNKDRLEKHQVICEKSSKKKRKVFDPVKMRVKGTESEGYLRKMKNKKPEKEAPKPAKKDWRKQHEEFIRNIRAAKKAQEHLAKGGKLADLPPPPPMDTSDYVQCPHCNRRFSAGAADRHIPKCSSIASNKSKPAAGRSAAAAKKPAPRASAASRPRR